jgi:hypothetical protein
MRCFYRIIPDMTSSNVAQNVAQNVTRKTGRIVEPAGPSGWYYSRGDDGCLTDPFDSREFAREGAAQDDRLGQWRRPEIDCEVFDAALIFEILDGLKEEAVWHESPPDRPQGEDAAELERRLAETLRDFMRERALFKQ